MRKEWRFYEIKNKQLFIYDSMLKDKSKTVIIAPVEDLADYKKQFTMKRVVK